MPALKFSYTPKLAKEGSQYGVDYTPIVPIVFTNPETKKSVTIDCLIDSGADDTIINARFAKLLGIDLSAGNEKLFQGISHAPVSAYEHPVTVQIERDTHTYPITCAFLPDLRTNGLLGQNGFFDNYKVTFEKYKKRFEITPRK